MNIKTIQIDPNHRILVVFKHSYRYYPQYKIKLFGIFPIYRNYDSRTWFREYSDAVEYFKFLMP